MDPSDLTIGDLLDALAGHKEKPLVFRYDGRPVKPGYHVTKVKAGLFSALDCGANPESWSEIFVQRWDVDEGEPAHMAAGKFTAIIRKVADRVAFDQSGQVDLRSQRRHPAHGASPGDPTGIGWRYRRGRTVTATGKLQAARWLEEQKAASASCCGASGCC